MNWTARPQIRYGVAAVGCLAVLAGALLSFNRQPAAGSNAAATEAKPPIRLVAGSTNTLELSSHAVNALGMRTVQVQSAADHERLTLSGKLSFDPDRFVRIHSRFPGEVVSIAQVASGPGGESRPLRVGDRVTKGQLLAIVSSKDIGEKKSALVDALSSLYIHEAQLAKLVPLESEVVAGKLVREAERVREADVIQVDRLERTLRSWRVSEDELQAAREEAAKIRRGESRKDTTPDKNWAKVEVRAPFDGTVLETTNAVPGVMVDTGMDLFKVADLSVLSVMANVFEEDLRAVDGLKPAQRNWTITLNSQANAPAIVGQFDRIGNTVDPNLHTALIRGSVDNRDGSLLAGQSITISIELPATPDEVVIPESALVDDGDGCMVFVADSETGSAVTRRHVAVVSRCQNVAYVRSQPTAEDEALGCECLNPGEWVVTSGSSELEAAMDSAVATSPQRDSVQN